MTSNTPAYLFPYPDPGDPIANGDDTIKALAQRIELVQNGGDVPDAWLAAAVNIAAGGNASMGSVTIPATYRRRNLVLALHFQPTASTANIINLTPNYADPRIVDPARAIRQGSMASSLEQVAYWHFQVNAGASGTTQFQVSIGAAVGFNTVRARAWVI